MHMRNTQRWETVVIQRLGNGIRSATEAMIDCRQTLTHQLWLRENFLSTPFSHSSSFSHRISVQSLCVCFCCGILSTNLTVKTVNSRNRFPLISLAFELVRIYSGQRMFIIIRAGGLVCVIMAVALVNFVLVQGPRRYFRCVYYGNKNEAEDEQEQERKTRTWNSTRWCIGKAVEKMVDCIWATATVANTHSHEHTNTHSHVSNNVPLRISSTICFFVVVVIFRFIVVIWHVPFLGKWFINFYFITFANMKRIRAKSFFISHSFHIVQRHTHFFHHDSATVLLLVVVSFFLFFLPSFPWPLVFVCRFVYESCIHRMGHNQHFASVSVSLIAIGIGWHRLASSSSMSFILAAMLLSCE